MSNLLEEILGIVCAQVAAASSPGAQGEQVQASALCAGTLATSLYHVQPEVVTCGGAGIAASVLEHYLEQSTPIPQVDGPCSPCSLNLSAAGSNLDPTALEFFPMRDGSIAPTGLVMAGVMGSRYKL